MGASDKERSRRTLLQGMALALGGIASASLLSRLLRRPRRGAGPSDLPGEGSIFQPRHDARLEEWERRQGPSSS